MSSKKEEKEYKIEFKIITLGNCVVGKKNIIKRFVNGNFMEHTITTIGISFSFKEVILKDGTKVSLKLIDTAGQKNICHYLNLISRMIMGYYLFLLLTFLFIKQ